MISRVYRATLFALYQLCIVIGIVAMPLAIATRQAGLSCQSTVCSRTSNRRTRPPTLNDVTHASSNGMRSVVPGGTTERSRPHREIGTAVRTTPVGGQRRSDHRRSDTT